MVNSADQDQLASSEATDLNLHCLQGRVYPGSAGQAIKCKYAFFGVDRLFE